MNNPTDMGDVMTFDVIRGIQAKREYVTMCSFATISGVVQTFDSKSTKSLKITDLALA